MKAYFSICTYNQLHYELRGVDDRSIKLIKHLLKKLKYYGINGKLYYWLSTWLTKRSQRVVVDGYESKYARVISGIPQGTVLGPVMFLLCINNINNNISSSLRLFADDCIIIQNYQI